MSGERGGQNNLKNTTSADPARSAEYAQSARARRRRKTSEVSQAILAAIPPLMGRRTAIFAAIARYGPLRVVDLEQALRVSMIREFRLETLGRAEPLGLITMWKTGRWLIIGFNPQFPLLEEMRDVLLALSRDVDFGIELTTLEHERQAPRSAARPVYPRYLFGSAVRTKAFAALEVLDGTAPSKRALAHAPPGQSPSMISRIIEENLERGILLVKNDGSVAFDDRHSVVVPLRRLLRSYVREHPLFAAAVRERAREKYKAVAEHHEFLFFGKPSYERLLMTLASEGPMHRARLFAKTMRKEWDNGAFTRLLDSGLVAQERRGRMTFVGLNSLHPAAGELRSLVLAMNGLHAGGEFLAERRESYGVTHLFTTKPRLNALRGLAEAPGREIDVSALERQFPLRDRAVLRGAFEHFETFGVVRERSARGLRLFSFDESWPHLPSLLALLDRIAQVWPQSKNKAGGVAATHPDKRRDKIPPRL